MFITRANYDQLLECNQPLLLSLFKQPYSWCLSGVTFHNVPIDTVVLVKAIIN